MGRAGRKAQVLCPLALFPHSWSMAERLVLGRKSSLWRHLLAGCVQTQEPCKAAGEAGSQDPHHLAGPRFGEVGPSL